MCDTSLYHGAELAAKSLLKRLDRNAHFRPFFNLAVRDGLMRAEHASWDCVDMTGRFIDAWILMRQMTEWPMTEEEEGVRRYLLTTQSPEDGLFYDFGLRIADCGQSGNHRGTEDTERESRGKGEWGKGSREVVSSPGRPVAQSFAELGEPETADMFCQSRALLGLTSWFLESGDAEIQDRIERLAQGLWNIAAKQDDFCYYPGHRYSPKGWEGVSAYTAKDLGHRALPAYGVLQILPLTRYWEATRSPAAERLILPLLNFFVRESGVVQADGSFTGHLHSWGILPSTVGVLRYAMAIGDEELILWCKRVYDFIVANSSSFGWVPDGIRVDDGIETGETCCITDLIHLGVKLAECGHSECLDYVEIMLRNQLLENQIRDTSRFKFESPEVEAMTYGAYDSWVMPNGLTGCSELGLEGCCTASAVRAVYLAWKHAVAYSNGEVRVNLMLCRRSEWVDAMSYQPFEGRFSLLVHKPVSLSIRVPSWIERAQLSFTLNGREAAPKWSGSYLRVDQASPGSRIDLEFPIPERETEETVRGRTYRLSWRGPTLMRIEPPGEIYPIFQRTLDTFRQLNTFDPARMKIKPAVEW